jgi:hypothetical protein
VALYDGQATLVRMFLVWLQVNCLVVAEYPVDDGGEECFLWVGGDTLAFAVFRVKILLDGIDVDIGVLVGESLLYVEHQ